MRRILEKAKRDARFRRVAILLGLCVVAGLSGYLLTREPGPFEGRFASYFLRYDPPRPAPLTAFSDGAGARLDLSAFRGEVVLVNFWATWCAPCVWEMPALDRLQQALGPEGFKVVAISEDREGLAVVQPFFSRLGLSRLGVFVNPSGGVKSAFGVEKVPTSFLIDGDGRVVGRVLGAVEWDSDGAKRLIRYYLEPGSD